MEFINNGTITGPKGFKAAGIFCGIKKRKKDLALIYSENACSAAGTFTTNRVKAAPVVLSMEIINSGKPVRALLVNSGNANSCTGEKGLQDAIESQKLCGRSLGIKSSEVLIASTGVIGVELPMDKLSEGIKNIPESLSCEGGHEAAEAIMTTDKKEKSFAAKINLSGGQVTIGAVCKGSGMIMPNMATMLGFFTTDANIGPEQLKCLLKSAVKDSFNKISVDGDTSTNDMVILLANGASEVSLNNPNDIEKFQEALSALAQKMAIAIVSDAEGGTKLVTINVSGAETSEMANIVAKTVANSSLVKTALNGCDANWGRIMSAAGMSGCDIDPEKMSIWFNDLPVIKPGYKIALDEAAALEILKGSEYEINIDLGIGNESTRWWTCDLSKEYVEINANYRT